MLLSCELQIEQFGYVAKSHELPTNQGKACKEKKQLNWPAKLKRVNEVFQLLQSELKNNTKHNAVHEKT